jgi:hypothetical protein
MFLIEQSFLCLITYSANTALEQLTAAYPNAFTFVAPLITDSATGIESITSAESHLKMWESFSMSSYGKHSE